MIKKILETETDPSLIDIFFSYLSNHQITELENNAPIAVRAGNIKVAGAII